MKDPTLKHVVEGNSIVNYTKSGVFFSSLRSWNRDDSFLVTKDTVIENEHVDPDGNGWLELKNSKGKRTFFVYKYAADFISEVKRKCL